MTDKASQQAATVATSVAKLPDDYVALVTDDERLGLFSSRSWFENFEQTILAESGRMHYVCHGYGAGLAVLPLWEPEPATLVQGRNVRQAGNYYTAHFGPLCAGPTADAERAVRGAIADVAARRPRWDSVALDLLDPESEDWRVLRAAFADQGWRTYSYFCHANWYLDCTELSFDDYLKSRGSSIRKSIANRERKFDRMDEGEFYVVDGPDQADEALAVFLELSRVRWEKDEPFPDFIPGLVSLGARTGWLRLAIAKIGGRPAAAQLWFVVGDRAYIYKVAYDDEFKSLSIGAVVTLKMMRHVIDVDEVNEVDFLTGDEGYKESWMSGRREKWGFLALNPRSPRGLARIALNSSKQVVKRLRTGGD